VRLFVGNLSFSSTEESIFNLFASKGFKPKAVSLVLDKTTNKSRGFGFVDVDSTNSIALLNALHGAYLDGRSLTVNEAQNKSSGKKSPVVESKYNKQAMVDPPIAAKSRISLREDKPVYPIYQQDMFTGKEPNSRRDRFRKKSRERNEDEDW
jgi:RNA recognition motif-containing protein